MASGDNGLGSVSILISGDYSRLASDFSTAQAMAGRAGAQISGALNSSFAPGMKAASGLVDQFGRSISSLAQPTEAATARTRSFAAATRESAAAAARMSAMIAEEAQQFKTLVLWANLAAAAQKGNDTAGGILAGKEKERTSFVGAIPGFGVAAERFIGMIPGLGPALMAAFPVFGAVALLQVLGSLTEKVVELYRSVADAKEKIGGAFLNATIGVRSTNDELRVTNDRISNTIARLEGKPQNNLKLALDEAVVSADKLASALAKDLDAIYKILSENKVGIGTAIFSAQRPTGDIAEEAGGRTGMGGFNANVAKVGETGRAAIRDATTEDQKRAAQTELNIRLTRLYDAEIAKLSAQLHNLPSSAIISSSVRLALRNLGLPINPFAATATAEEMIQGRINNLKQQKESIPLRAENDEGEAKQKQIEESRRVAGEAARIDLARITNRMAASVRVYDAERRAVDQTIALSHQEAQGRIEAITAPSSRAIAEADEEVRIATERAEKLGAINRAEVADKVAQITTRSRSDQAGKDPSAAAAARIAAEGEIAATRDSAAQKDIELQGAVALATSKAATVRITENRKVAAEWDKEIREGFQTLDREWKEALTRGERYAAQQGAIMTRVWEIEARSKGNVKASGIEGQQIDVQTKLRTTPGLNLQNQVALMQQLAGLDQQAIAERRAGLSEELRIAKTIEDEGRGKIEVARIQAQINQLDADGANTAKRAQAEILELKYRQSFAAKLDQAGRQLPGQVGGALAKGVTGGGKIGQDISQALKGAGQQLLGTAFTAIIQRLIVQLGISTLAQTALQFIFGANTAVQVANTTAVTANATATASLAIGNIPLITAMIGLTAAVTALTAATVVDTIIPFADGGRPPVGVPSLVGENGPELFIPGQAGTIIPHHQLGNHIGKGTELGMPLASPIASNLILPPSSPSAGSPGGPAALMAAAMSSASSSSSSSIGAMHFNIHGSSNPRETVRQIANYLKSTSSRYQIRG